MTINFRVLMRELKEAGIAIGGCNSLGIVWDVDGATEIQDRADVAAVVAAHDPFRLDYVKLRKENAITSALASPISSMTVAEANDWVNQNISTSTTTAVLVANLKIALKAIILLVFALRDYAMDLRGQQID